jgi:tetratricopeptide (TPR) repeat protein
MKYMAILTLICWCLQASAQQSAKADYALLLDYYQNQHFADAVNYLKGIYPEPINDVKVLSQLAYTSQMAGKLPDAEGYYQRIYEQDTTNKSILYNIAGINQRRGNIAKAETYYKKFIAKDSTNFLVYKQLAQISDEKADITSQFYYLQKANKLNPTEPDIASDLSDRYVLLKQLASAKKVLNAAIIADPENIILQQSLLKINYADNKWPEAIKTGEQLLLLGDSSTATVSKLGRAYYQAKYYQCGIAILTTIPALNQTETTTYYIGICYKQLKDQKNAIVYLNKAIALSLSTNIDTYYNEMADSYEIINLFKKARDAYQRGLLFNEKPLTFYFLANLYDIKLKDKKSALKYFKKYMTSKPDEKQQTYIAYSKSRIAALSR